MHRILVAALLAGCVKTTFAYTPSSNAPVSAKPAGCAFQVLTTPPTELEEVGVLELYNGEAPKDLDKFRADVAKQVCGSGGDAVIPIADDKGRYSKGTVIKYPKRPDASAM